MAKKHIFHPQVAVHWPQFILGSLIAGLLLGIGWQIGATIVNHWFDRHEHDKTAVDPRGRY